MDESIRSGQIVQSLAGAVQRGASSLNNVPKLLTTIIEEQRWRSYTGEMTKNKVTFKTFREFVAAPLPDGLETDYVTLKALCSMDKETQLLLHQAMFDLLK